MIESVAAATKAVEEAKEVKEAADAKDGLGEKNANGMVFDPEYRIVVDNKQTERDSMNDFNPDKRVGLDSNITEQKHKSEVYNPDNRVSASHELKDGTRADFLTDEGRTTDTIKEGSGKELLDDSPDNIEKEGLTIEDKIKVKEQTGWSDEVINHMRSMEEAKVYMAADLKEMEINDKKCLVRNDIDWNQKDDMGRTNKERAEQGLSPITKEGKTVELHHIGQHADSPLAELTPEEHRGKGNDAILHDKTKKSEIDRPAFEIEKRNHWETRTQKGGNS